MGTPVLKVCGMADADNMREVAALTPDMMGFIFYRPSPRNAFGLAPAAVRGLPETIRKVGVFVDEPMDAVLRKAEEYGLDAVQLHGGEAPELCGTLRDRGLEVFKAFGISSREDLTTAWRYEGVCELLLFDTKTPLKGGSGLKFDHSVLESYTGPTPFLLSGGIGPEEAGIDTGRYPGCAGFDLNSRFETSPGIKDISRLSEFIETVRIKI
ncbi:MAG: phosphoribosylanthranilate isomerase [Rikenellaceae bacterium]|nr:phosphoribosylanthranilate isomerase [Rikenellaceae bacterium]